MEREKEKEREDVKPRVSLLQERGPYEYIMREALSARPLHQDPLPSKHPRDTLPPATRPSLDPQIAPRARPRVRVEMRSHARGVEELDP